MRKIAVMFMVIFSIMCINEVTYAKSGKGNKNDNRKNEKDIRDESGRAKNQKSVDAGKNWGQLKRDLKSDDNYDALREFYGVGFDESREYTDKELKESIKAERRVRRELRKNESALSPNIDIEMVVDEYLYRNTERVENYLSGLEDFDPKSLDRMTRAKEKYDNSIERSEVNK